MVLIGCASNVQQTTNSLEQKAAILFQFANVRVSRCESAGTGVAVGTCIGRAYDNAIKYAKWPTAPGPSLQLKLAALGELYDRGQIGEQTTWLQADQAIRDHLISGAEVEMRSAQLADQRFADGLAAFANSYNQQRNFALQERAVSALEKQANQENNFRCHHNYPYTNCYSY
jgi:hypothetical protein